MKLLRPALCLALSMPLAALAADDVRVYRCVGSNGAVALQDKPCTAGRQQVRDLQRPRDPPPRVVSTDTAPPAPVQTPALATGNAESPGRAGRPGAAPPAGKPGNRPGGCALPISVTNTELLASTAKRTKRRYRSSVVTGFSHSALALATGRVLLKASLPPAAMAQDPALITVTGESTAQAAPDLATVDLGVTTEGPSAAEALSAAADGQSVDGPGTGWLDKAKAGLVAEDGEGEGADFLDVEGRKMRGPIAIPGRASLCLDVADRCTAHIGQDQTTRSRECYSNNQCSE